MTYERLLEQLSSDLDDLLGEDGVPVLIPKSLYAKLEKRLMGKEFGTVGAYVLYILEQVVSEGNENPPVFTKEDEERIRENLKSLGYV